MAEALILSAVRTPIGKFLGGLAELTAPQLGAIVVREALSRAKLAGSAVDEVILGNVVQAGVGQNPARQAALAGGLPDTIAAVTINKVCGSGLKAVMLAAQAVRAGDAHLVVAGGMESMSRAPHLLSNTRTGWKYGPQTVEDALIRDGLWCAFEQWPMGQAAEYTAEQFGISRELQDRFSEQSHRRAAQASQSGAFEREMVPVTLGSGPKQRSLTADEGIRPDTTSDSLARLKPAFRDNGTVTAGNASQLSDGAAAVVVASDAAAERLGQKPLGRIVAYATAGVAPRDLFIAPVPAIRAVLERAKLTLDDIDLIELNEAFAAQVLACQQQLGLDPAKLNVHGGAIALGHPIGASGARVLVTLLHALHARGGRRGLASLCLGGGNAVAMIVDRD
jgi:acetyl-CoA C-acetyltransferase